jgi:hypothetical protein
MECHLAVLAREASTSTSSPAPPPPLRPSFRHLRHIFLLVPKLTHKNHVFTLFTSSSLPSASHPSLRFSLYIPHLALSFDTSLCITAHSSFYPLPSISIRLLIFSPSFSLSSTCLPLYFLHTSPPLPPIPFFLLLSLSYPQQSFFN